MQCNLEFESELNICDKDEENKGRRVGNLELLLHTSTNFIQKVCENLGPTSYKTYFLCNEKDEPAKTI
jgi:hypothetical protein